VLAGVSLALMSGGQRPVAGRERLARSGGMAVRAVLIAALGMALAELGTGIAVILTYYGLLFLCGLPFLGWGPRPLAALSVAWVVVAPVVSQLVRPHLPERGFQSPTLGQLADPGQLFGELLLTGYYPVLPWLAYLLVGMALGRLDLRSRRVQGWLVGLGGVTAIASTTLSHALTRQPSVAKALVSDPPTAETGSMLLERIAKGVPGTTPTGGAWEWLLVVAPHSATPFDLAQTIGSALLVIGLCLLLVGSLPQVGVRFVAVLFGAGTMTLTLYTLHVVMRTSDVWPAETPDSYRWHVLVVLAIGSAYAGLRQRGPLERLVGHASDAMARRVRARS
jgi:Heparan-alpha-glucosaminide N-acetyltransferase, catalytic